MFPVAKQYLLTCFGNNFAFQTNERSRDQAVRGGPTFPQKNLYMQKIVKIITNAQNRNH